MIYQLKSIQLPQCLRLYRMLLKKTLKLIGKLIVLLSVYSQANEAIVLPELGNSSAGLMSAQDEKALGQAWLKSFRGSVMLESDPIIFEYLENLLFKLASYSQLKDKDLHLVVVKNPNINAFAVPGGVVGVNSGLLLYAETEGQLASVLSHELAHLSQRHFSRSVEAAKGTNLTTLAGMLAGIALAIASESDAAQAAIVGSQAAALDAKLRYSRMHEKEADRIGMMTLVNAGYSANSAAAMFKQMLNISRLYGNKTPEFLLTHPITESRIADARNRARQYNSSASKLHLNYLLIKARAYVLAQSSNKNSITHFLSQLEKFHSKQPIQNSSSEALYAQAARYGLAFAYQRDQQWHKARKTLAPLLEKIPRKITYSLLDIAIDSGLGKTKVAENRLRELSDLTPNNYAISMQLAEILLKNNNATEAQKVLSSLAKTRPAQADIWYALAESQGLAGNINGLHQSRAEFFLLRGNLTKAKMHYRQALHLSQKDFQRSAKIKHRLSFIRKLEEQAGSF
ncbi:MAG: M48 family metalloprotease [Pseudomonadota bacterium]|nr:M48 family metalloprotease [Pseudomonadota bacterium]